MITKYDVIIRPLVTEKSNKQSSRLRQYAFVVHPDATRTMVKDALQDEEMFGVTVERVNIVNAPAKRGRRAKSRRLLVRRSSFKKAIVTLTVDSKPLEGFEGVQVQ